MCASVPPQFHVMSSKTASRLLNKVVDISEVAYLSNAPCALHSKLSKDNDDFDEGEKVNEHVNDSWHCVLIFFVFVLLIFPFLRCFSSRLI